MKKKNKNLIPAGAMLLPGRKPGIKTVASSGGEQPKTKNLNSSVTGAMSASNTRACIVPRGLENNVSTSHNLNKPSVIISSLEKNQDMVDMMVPTIFKKNLKNNSKLRPYNNFIGNTVGHIQYFPAWSKEWRNSVYHFNSNLIKNFPVHDINIVKLIKSYFGIFFNSHFLKFKHILNRRRRLSFNKIFFARPEIKHTNSRATITLYTFNREKIALSKKIGPLSFLTWNLLCLLQSGSYSTFKLLTTFKVRKPNILGKRNRKGLITKWIWDKEVRWVKYYNRYKGYLKKIEKIFFRFNMMFSIMKNRDLLQDFYTFFSTLKTSRTKAKQQANKLIKIFFKRQFTLIRKYKFKLNLNKYKFEEKLLHKLSSIISKLYNKQIEFNIVNLKTIVYNTDLFTEISTLKIKKRNTRVSKIMYIMLNKVKLPRENSIQEKGRVVKIVDYSLPENKYGTLSIKDILSGKLNLDKLFNKLYTNVRGGARLPWSRLRLLQPAGSSPSVRRGGRGIGKFLPIIKANLYNIIFNSIKYKILRGIRMEVKGRLTPRYRADRSVYKVKWKGGLKNTGSSYKGLSVRKNRGHLNPNVSYSIFSSKRRVGAFAVKGWTGAKYYSTNSSPKIAPVVKYSNNLACRK